jgi:hypothetical protein
VNWIVIFAMFSTAHGYRSLEYRILSTEQQCQEIGERAVRETKQRLGEETWVDFHCIDVTKLKAE